MSSWLDKLNNPPREFRGIPFWSWNDELDPEELRRQVREMKRVGLGGYFMHARGGLRTPYMGEKWMECIRACIDEGKKIGISSWLYDEYGWPSGFAGGAVSHKGLDYQQKSLICKTQKGSELTLDDKTIAVYTMLDGKAERLPSGFTPNSEQDYSVIFYTVNPYYVDLLDKKVISAFLESTHERYLNEAVGEFNEDVPGMFTDEPQLPREHLPWSFVLPEEFKNAYGYDLLDVLPALFYKTEGYQAARYDFWRLVSELFVGGFGKTIGEWCDSHGCTYTGHVINEDSLLNQMQGTGGAMPFYEYMSLPGIDWLGRGIGGGLTPKQVSSAARQLGKKLVLSEMFGCSGWNVSFEELKWIAEWQYALGINVMCQHLEGYSLKGLRKRDYPPSLFYHQPWWEEYKTFNDYFARLGMLLSEGQPITDVLVLHPIRSAWIAYTEGETAEVERLDDALNQVISTLLRSQIDFDFGDEEIIRKHARIDGTQFKIGQCSYTTLVIPPCQTLDKSTLDLVCEFASNGGKVIAVGQLPTLVAGRADESISKLQEIAQLVPLQDDKLRDSVLASLTPEITIRDKGGNLAPDILIHGRDLGDSKLYFLVNTSQSVTYDLQAQIPGAENMAELNLEDNSLHGIPSPAGITLLPMQSIILVTGEQTESAEPVPARIDKQPIELEADWSYELTDMNALTLDFCRYRIEDNDWQEPIPVIELQKKLVDLGRPADVELEFSFEIDPALDPSQVKFAVLEEPESFDIRINGQPVTYTDQGWWRDKGFSKVNLQGLCKTGTNTITLSRRFFCAQRVYDLLNDPNAHEAELNILNYDVELESIYIIGSFAVRSLGEWTEGRNKALFTDGPFVLSQLPEKLSTGDLTTQGLPFFSGGIKLTQQVRIPEVRQGVRYIIDLDQPSAMVAKVYVNDHLAGARMWKPFEVDVTPFIKQGPNKVTVEITGTNRNLLGPHHLVIGESYFVGPSSFTKTGGWTEGGNFGKPIWKDRYCFVQFGL